MKSDEFTNLLGRVAAGETLSAEDMTAAMGEIMSGRCDEGQIGLFLTALAAIVVPAFLRPEDQIDLWQPRFVAGVVAALVAWRTRNIALTLVLGIGIVMLIDAL